MAGGMAGFAAKACQQLDPPVDQHTEMRQRSQPCNDGILQGLAKLTTISFHNVL